LAKGLVKGEGENLKCKRKKELQTRHVSSVTSQLGKFMLSMLPHVQNAR